MEKDCLAIVIAQWPHGFGELCASNFAVWRCRDERSHVPMFTSDVERDGCPRYGNFTVA